MYGSPPPPPVPPPSAAAPPPLRDLNCPFPNHKMSSGLLRYRSAPCSILGEVCEDFPPIRATSPETETIFARFLSPESPQFAAAAAAAAAGPRNSQFPPHPPPPPPPPPPPAAASATAAAEENSNSLGFSSAMIYQHQNPVQNHQMAMAAADQIKNNSNLIRQSSSPAGLFSHLNVENGYGVMRGINTGFRNETSNEGGGSRLKSQLSFSSSRQSSLLSQISEIENESIGGYPLGSWEESPLLSPNHFSSSSSSGHKRPRDNSVTENGEFRNGLSHELSMPKTSSELAAIEKFLQFQDSVPCRIRAKRGCATHPRSIAERVRRTRISERMRKLQELVPNMDKQTNTADMLDLAVDYIKDLQKQVKTISDSRASCTCSSSKHKPYTNSTV